MEYYKFQTYMLRLYKESLTMPEIFLHIILDPLTHLQGDLREMYQSQVIMQNSVKQGKSKKEKRNEEKNNHATKPNLSAYAHV